MSWLVQPRLVNGSFDDPGLYLDFRFGRRAILFDLGDLTPLSSRELMRVSHVFVSHTHMDHIAGFDRLLRVCLHRTEPLTLAGPSGFIDQVEHRIRSFTWNLLDEHSIDFRLHIMEFESERLVRAAEFRARDAFVRRNGAPPDYPPGTVLAEENMRVEAVALDHGIPSLAFALREELKVNVLRGALDEMGLATGPWLGGAKRAARRGEPDDSLIDVGRDHTIPLGELRRRAFRIGPGQIVAYVTDAASHAENHRKIVRLAEKADQLFIEAMFLEKDRALATATRHLTARDAGALARAAHVKHFTVFHHSTRYLPDPSSIGREVRDGFEAIPA